MRFMAIGGLSSLVAVVERFATRREIPGLVDAAVHADVETNWHCRLRELVIYDKYGNDRPQILWQVLEEAGERDSGMADEWIYQLANRVPNPWEEYNVAALLWIDGDSDGARQRAVESGRATKSDVADAMDLLQ
eukprot:gene17638-biopygen11540